MRFKKIGYDGKKVLLIWEVKIGGVTGNYKVEGESDPSPGFRDALTALGTIALSILEFPRSIQNLKATGVSFSENKDGVRGAVITTVKNCKATKVATAINTPYLEERKATQKESPGFYIDGMQEALDTMEEEANLYFKGLDRQGSLFEQPAVTLVDDDEDDDDDNDDDEQSPPAKLAAAKR